MNQPPLSEENLPEDSAPPPASSRKAIIVFAGLLILLFGVIGGIYAYVGNFMNPSPPSQSQGQVSSEPLSPTKTRAPISGTGQGTISGRLCFPSEGVPPGNLMVKDTTSGVMSTTPYLGTSAGAPSDYSITVTPGTYILRFEVYYDVENPKNYARGYHTTVCPTGGEESCSDQNKRINIEIPVSGNENITGVDLCDYYYLESTEPDF